MSQCKAQSECCNHSILFFVFLTLHKQALFGWFSPQEKRVSIVSVSSAQEFKIADGGEGIKTLLSEFVQTGTY